MTAPAPFRRPRLGAWLASSALALLALLAGLASQPALANSFDLRADWSDTHNPNGVWSYRRAGAAFAAPLADWSGFGPAWGDSACCGFGFTPMLLKYDGVGSEAIDAQLGDIVGHTNTHDANAGAGELSVVFASPWATLATVSGAVWDAHSSVHRDQTWTLLANNVVLASGVIAGDGSNGRAAPDSFSFSGIALGAGQTVELLLKRADGHNGGLVGLSLTVVAAPVPEPAVLPLMALGLLGTLLAARRARRPGA